ncbi:MAG: enoyl-CoA hydratase/isomerase family protein [Pseudomonadota bacterium]
MIEVDVQDGATRLMLARPEKANALTEDMLRDLRDAVRSATTAVLVLTGQGQVFSAGADLDAARNGLAISPLWEELSSAIANYPGLTIAALNGSVAGGAMGMVLACDLRVAVPMAKFFYPVMELGFLPQPSDPGRMAALTSPAKAKRLFMTGEKIDGHTALEWGLLDELSEPADLMSLAMAWADKPKKAKTGHAAAIKALF